LRGYVSRGIFEEALKTKDPTQPGYRGVNPNFGGGNQDEGEGLGS